MLFQSGIVNRQRAGGLIQTSLPRQRYGVCPDAVRNRCAAVGACAAPAVQTSTNSFEGERTRGLRGFHQSILRRNREGTDSTKRGQVKSCSLAERTRSLERRKQVVQDRGEPEHVESKVFFERRCSLRVNWVPTRVRLRIECLTFSDNDAQVVHRPEMRAAQVPSPTVYVGHSLR